MPVVAEEWRQIEEFPLYEVSNLARVANIKTDILVQPSRTMQGALKVGLYINTKQYTRSLKVLVAEAFVERPSGLFDTPVHLDGDQENCVAYNLMWRPRWHAWNYTRQFRDVNRAIYRMGPIVELDEEGIVVAAYDDLVEAGTRNGLLFDDIWKSLHLNTRVFPTTHRFAFADKV